jgi:ATP synthase protein I
MPDDSGNKPRRSQYRSVYQGLTLAFVFPVATALGYGAGYGLDKLFGTKPWMTAIFTAFGIAAGFINLFRAGKEMDAGSGDSSDQR